MIAHVVIHEVLYSAHTDGFERIKKPCQYKPDGLNMESDIQEGSSTVLL